MLDALLLSFGQLTDRRFIRIWLTSAAVALTLFGIAGWSFAHLLGSLDTSGWPRWLAASWTWLDGLGGFLLAALALALLFPAIATGVMSLFLDEVVAAVEQRHYPRLSPPRRIGLPRAAAMSLSSALRLIIWNLLALPLYLLSLVTVIGVFPLFFAINGWLLGRDYMQMVAIRHLPPEAERRFRREERGAIWAVGLTTSALFLLPLVNLVAPLVGAAFATHLFHRQRLAQPT